MGNGLGMIPRIELNTGAILLKADNSPDAITIESNVSGVGFAIGKDGGILIIDRHGFFGRRLEDMKVLHQELGYVIEEAERWQKT